MIELPGSLRELLRERVDEALETSGAETPKEWVQSLFTGLDAAAEELDEDLGENLILRLEESGELEQSLADELEDNFDSLNDPAADDLMRIMDSVCEVAWIDEDGDAEIAKGFMESDGYEDEDY